ncbi:hypothetical protein J3L18_11225 [Mucilaginibacter gossypii]|uniref:hypothetical protein n=1 Tax=Mucilaginibacter gossypii TaxID=551996 RepID=UPI000DCE8B50|nr:MULTISPECIES: hypothetical protein [Mucilaginibacter]QTE39598.1 hypothetical protein J3L18_11225 [Mucilaginibacter gossypii]RAV53978.1 hypothetical protein DIU36_21790 [Mucilaginibacter rubeus]
MKTTLLFPLTILLLFSCSGQSHKRSNIDEFYTAKGEWDSARLPFIKPYEAIIVTKESGWGMNLEGIDGDTGFSHIKKANVIDGVILVYYTNSILHGNYVKEGWYVVVPAKKIERVFSTHKKYLKYLESIHISAEPILYDIESIADYYEYHDIIDWKKIH